MDFEETVCIIRSSELEDATILEHNYSGIINDLPECDERQRFILLKCETQERIKELAT